MPISKRPTSKFFELADYVPHPIQEKIHRSKRKRRIACLGRQVGKSEAGSIEACFELFTAPGAVGWVVAPTYDQAEIIFGRVLNKAEKIAEKLPHILLSAQARKLRMRVIHYDMPVKDEDGNRINKDKAKVVAVSEFRGKSADRPDNLRGATLDFIIIDEAAMITYSVWTEAIEPMLSTRDGWALIISTPKGYNWFYNFFKRGWRGKGALPVYSDDIELPIIAPDTSSAGELMEDFESFHSTSWEVWDKKRAWYAGTMMTTPDMEFRQEYGAEFISNSGSVFSGMGSITRLPYYESEDGKRIIVEAPRKGRDYVIGVDFGKNQDFSVFSVLDAEKGAIVALERTNETAWKEQVRRLKNLTMEYNDALCVVDAWGVGNVLVEDLAEFDISFMPYEIKSVAVKEELIRHFNLLMEQGQIAVPDHPQIFDELRNFQYFKSATGISTMRASGRGHDDIVISLALAYYLYEGNGTLHFDLEMQSREAGNEKPTASTVDFTSIEIYDFNMTEANRMFM